MFRSRFSSKGGVIVLRSYANLSILIILVYVSIDLITLNVNAHLCQFLICVLSDARGENVR